MSGSPPRLSGSQLENDRRVSIDDNAAKEEINLDEINSQRPPSTSQQSVTEDENQENEDADADASEDDASAGVDTDAKATALEDDTSAGGDTEVNAVEDDASAGGDAIEDNASAGGDAVEEDANAGGDAVEDDVSAGGDGDVNPEGDGDATLEVDTESELADDAYFFDDHPPPLCGWCCIRPACIQCCRTQYWMLFALCITATIQGMVINGFYTIDITTIERRFGLRSSQTGLIAGSYDMAAIVSLIPVTYFGGKPEASKPKWLGCGIFVMGIGSLVFTVPHFAVAKYEVDVNKTSLCFDEHEEVNEIVYEDLSYLRWVFFVGQFLHGLGTSPLYTLGVTYIDENVRTLNSSVFLAIYYNFAIVGAAVGYIIGGLLLRIFTNLSVDPRELGLTPDSSAWVGAWWIGYFISAALCFVMAIWLLAFPPYLPATPALRAEKMSEREASRGWKKVKSDDDDEDDDEKVKDDEVKSPSMFRSVLELCQKPTIFFVNLAAASESFINTGFLAFLPKYIENQFSINPTHTSIILGAVAIPTGAGGTFLGAFLVRKFRLQCPGILKLCIITTFLGLLFVTAFLFTCPNQSFAGVTSTYPDSTSDSRTLNQTCNENCDCTPKLYDPICGIDKSIYYSPCYAGCLTELSCDKMRYFSDCKCIGGTEDTCSEEDSNDNTTEEDSNDNTTEEHSEREERKTKEIPEHEAAAGTCEADCGNLIPFTFLIVLELFCTFMTAMPALAASLRCVGHDQRSVALGLQWFTVRLLGSTPSPILFGVIIDATCLLWKDENGSCLIFDNAGLSFYIMFLMTVGKCFNILFYFVALMCYKEPVVELEEDEESLLQEGNERTTYGTNG